GKSVLTIGVDVLPNLPKDATDRNRTSPFAFTGNKFEFRMLGSTVSIGCPNMILNTIVADVLCKYADRLEKAKNFDYELEHLIRHAYRDHKRIVFNGDGYTEGWVKEAEKRGLLNLATTADCMPLYKKEENIKLFEKYGVLSRMEVCSRCEIQMENYNKQQHIEALTMEDMIQKQIFPAMCSYMKMLSEEISLKKQIGAEISYEVEETLLKKLSSLSVKLFHELEALKKAVSGEQKITDVEKLCRYCADVLLVQMEKTRAVADQIEPLVGKTYWPYPCYGDLLFSVN
ncbi:MAG TPA: glutamine synthetase, partial [Ruminococcaceae bacterium]|nr:glutamine synthetase [Oscillospiraceae bacterium]